MSIEGPTTADETYVRVGQRRRLLGASCSECALTVFPGQPGCPGCGRPTMERRVLADRGTLWSYTVQCFPPKPVHSSSPDEPGGEVFQPYGVGYVELPDGVIVEALLTENDPGALRIGMTMELVTRCGEDFSSPRFRPATSDGETV